MHAQVLLLDVVQAAPARRKGGPLALELEDDHARVVPGRLFRQTHVRSVLEQKLARIVSDSEHLESV